MPLTLFFGNYLGIILSSDRGGNYVNKSNAPATYDIIFGILRMITREIRRRFQIQIRFAAAFAAMRPC